MNKNIFMGICALLMTTGVFAAQQTAEQKDKKIQCPEPKEIVATQPETKEHGVTSMVYCAPSATDCQWKGFDAKTDKKQTVAKSLQKNRVPDVFKDGVYCHYELKDKGKRQMRMKFEKRAPKMDSNTDPKMNPQMNEPKIGSQ